MVRRRALLVYAGAALVVIAAYAASYLAYRGHVLSVEHQSQRVIFASSEACDEWLREYGSQHRPRVRIDFGNAQALYYSWYPLIVMDRSVTGRSIVPHTEYEQPIRKPNGSAAQHPDGSGRGEGE